MGATTTTAPWHKANCIWPVQRGPAGWVRKTLATRLEAAIRHLMLTPRGSLTVDPHYGTSIYKLRTQPVSDEKAQLIKAEMADALARYAPDVVLHSLDVEVVPGEQRLKVTAVWTLRQAQAVHHVGLDGPREVTVLI